MEKVWMNEERGGRGKNDFKKTVVYSVFFVATVPLLQKLLVKFFKKNEKKVELCCRTANFLSVLN